MKVAIDVVEDTQDGLEFCILVVDLGCIGEHLDGGDIELVSHFVNWTFGVNLFEQRFDDRGIDLPCKIRVIGDPMVEMGDGSGAIEGVGEKPRASITH